MTTTEAPIVNDLGSQIFQLCGTRRSAHAYLLRGRRRVALIDTGLPYTEAYMTACLAQCGLSVADIDVVVLSHEHVDHAGGAPLFASHSLIAAHPQAANKLRLADEFSLMTRAFSENATVQFEVDLLLEEGSAIDLGDLRLEVLHTPGHCSGSICLYEPDRRMLFSADTIMARGVIGGVLNSGNTCDYITSLERLKRLRVDLLLPGHGNSSTDVEADIATGVARLQALLDDSHTLFSALRDTRDGFDDIMRSLRDLNVM